MHISILAFFNRIINLIRLARASHGIDFLIGFEIEVFLLKETDPPTPVNDYSHSDERASIAGTIEAKVLAEIASTLESQGIDLIAYHSEIPPGQYEFIPGPLPPLEACDALYITRQTVLNVCAKNGIHATFAPKVIGDHGM